MSEPSFNESFAIIPAQPGWTITWPPGEAAAGEQVDEIIAWEIRPHTDEHLERQVIPITIHGREHPGIEKIGYEP